MKKPIFLGAICSAFLLTIISCKKDTLTQPRDSSVKSVEKSTELLIEYTNEYGETVDISSYQDNQSCVIFVTDHPDEGYDLLVKVFDSEINFEHFLDLDPDKYAKIKYDLSFSKHLSELAHMTGDDQLGDSDDDVYSSEVKDLLKSYSPPADNDGKAYGLLWDSPNASGTFRPVTHLPSPSFGSFNNKAESFTGLGSFILCSNTWFKGRKVIVWGTPNSVVNLNNLGIGNDSESRI